MQKQKLNATELEGKLTDGVEKESLYIPALERDGFGLLPRLPMMGKELDLNAKALLTIMYSYAHTTNAENDNASCVAFPGRDTLMAISKMSKPTYYRALNQLIDKGFVSVKQERKQTENNNNRIGWAHNIYTLENNPICYKNGEAFVYDTELYVGYQKMGVNCKGRGAVYKRPLLACSFSTKAVAAYGYICAYNCFGVCRLNLDLMRMSLGLGRDAFAKVLYELNCSGYVEVERIKMGKKYTNLAIFSFICPTEEDNDTSSENVEIIKSNDCADTCDPIIIEDDVSFSISGDIVCDIPETEYSDLDDDYEDFEETHLLPNEDGKNTVCHETEEKTFAPEIIKMPMGVDKVERGEDGEGQREIALGNKEDRHANLAYKQFQFSTDGPWGYVGDALNHLAVRLSIQQVADIAWVKPVNDLMLGIKNLLDKIDGNNLIEVGGCGWYAPVYVLQRFADLPENQCLAALRRYVNMDHSKIHDKPTYLLTALWNEMNDPKYYSYVGDDADDYWA